MLKIYQKPDSDQPASSYQTEGKNDNLLIISTIIVWNSMANKNSLQHPPNIWEIMVKNLFFQQKKFSSHKNVFYKI
jgi:hypothetical protein